MKPTFTRIAIAPNGFKGTLTAAEAARAIERGLKRAIPGATFVTVPMADGGDGTAAAIVGATGGRWVRLPGDRPLGPRPAREIRIDGRCPDGGG